jgi:VanZ family protein
MQDVGRPGAPLSRIAFAAAALLSLVVLFTPASGVPWAPPGVDKLVHAALFAGLAVTGRWAGAGLRRLAVLLAVYAVVSEVVQAWSPLGRTGSPADVLADVVGLLLGLLAWERPTRPRPAG